ncbi:MAG: hypothetical protein ABIG84_00395 [archaeon]
MRMVLLGILLVLALLLNPMVFLFLSLAFFVILFRHEIAHVLTEVALFIGLLVILIFMFSSKAILVILTAPFRNFDILWAILPLLLAWIVLEVYFSKHEDENMGWNTAVCNGLMLFWAGLNILFSLSRTGYVLMKIAVMVILMGYGVFLAYAAFTHRYSSGLTFRLASTNVVYYSGIMGVLYAHDVVLLTVRSVSSSFVLLGLILLLIRIVKKIRRVRRNGSKTDDAGLPEKDGRDAAPIVS